MQSLNKKGMIRYKQQGNKFNYQVQPEKALNLHHEYFELYDQHTQQNQESSQNKYHTDSLKNTMTYQHNNITQSLLRPYSNQRQQSLQLNNPFPKIDEWLNDENKRIMLQNNRLQKQLMEKSVENQNLKKDLQQCRRQLSKIKDLAKIEQYHHKDIVLQLTEQIQIILDNNKSMILEIRQLKNAVNAMNQEKYYSVEKYPKIKEVRSYSYSKEKQSNVDYAVMSSNEEYNYQKMTKLFNSIKEMYKKIMGLELTSLKQLWRWLKSVGLGFSLFKKWKSRTVNLLKASTYMNKERCLELLNEICQIII